MSVRSVETPSTDPVVAAMVAMYAAADPATQVGLKYYSARAIRDFLEDLEAAGFAVVPAGPLPMDTVEDIDRFHYWAVDVVRARWDALVDRVES